MADKFDLQKLASNKGAIVADESLRKGSQILESYQILIPLHFVFSWTDILRQTFTSILGSFSNTTEPTCQKAADNYFQSATLDDLHQLWLANPRHVNRNTKYECYEDGWSRFCDQIEIFNFELSKNFCQVNKYGRCNPACIWKEIHYRVQYNASHGWDHLTEVRSGILKAHWPLNEADHTASNTTTEQSAPTRLFNDTTAPTVHPQAISLSLFDNTLTSIHKSLEYMTNIESLVVAAKKLYGEQQDDVTTHFADFLGHFNKANEVYRTSKSLVGAVKSTVDKIPLKRSGDLSSQWMTQFSVSSLHLSPTLMNLSACYQVKPYPTILAPAGADLRNTQCLLQFGQVTSQYSPVVFFCFSMTILLNFRVFNIFSKKSLFGVIRDIWICLELCLLAIIQIVNVAVNHVLKFTANIANHFKNHFNYYLQKRDIVANAADDELHKVISGNEKQHTNTFCAIERIHQYSPETKKSGYGPDGRTFENQHSINDQEDYCIIEHVDFSDLLSWGSISGELEEDSLESWKAFQNIS
jgi:hypothetical protein